MKIEKQNISNVKINFLYNATYQLLTILLPLVTASYISRILGAENIGVYSYTKALSSYFVIFAMLGITNYGNRSCAMVRDNREELSRTFCSIYYLQIITAITSIILYLIYIIVFIKENKVVYLLWGFYVFSSLFDINWLFFGIEKFKITVTRNIIIKLFSVICIFLFIKKEEDLWIYILIISGSFLLTNISIFPFINRYIDWTFLPFSEVKKHIKPILLLFIPVIAVSLYNIMDKIMLGMMSSMTEIGYYENTEKIITVPTSLIMALGTVMLPRMSYLAANGEEEKSREMIQNSMFFVLFIGSAMTFGISAIAPKFVPWFFGDNFLDCISLIIWMSPKILFVSWANVIRTQYLLPHKRDFDYIMSVITGAIVNLVLNLILIPKFDALGAVLSTIVAEIAVAIVQTFSVRKELDFLKYLKSGIPFIVNGGAMFFVVRLLSSLALTTSMTISIQIIIGGIVYLLFSAIYLYCSHREILLQLIKLPKKNGSLSKSVAD